MHSSSPSDYGSAQQVFGCHSTVGSFGTTSLCSNTCLQNYSSCPLATFNSRTPSYRVDWSKAQSAEGPMTNPASNASSTVEQEYDQSMMYIDEAAESTQGLIDQKARQAHSLVEKKYRESLNGQIEKLRFILPNCHVEQDIEDQAAGTEIDSLSKIAVLTTAHKLLKKLAAANRQQELQNKEALNQLQRIQEIADCRTCGVTECAKSYGVLIDT